MHRFEHDDSTAEARWITVTEYAYLLEQLARTSLSDWCGAAARLFAERVVDAAADAWELNPGVACAMLGIGDSAIAERAEIMREHEAEADRLTAEMQAANPGSPLAGILAARDIAIKHSRKAAPKKSPTPKQPKRKPLARRAPPKRKPTRRT